MTTAVRRTWSFALELTAACIATSAVVIGLLYLMGR